MNTITTKDGTQIYYKDWARENPSFSAMVGPQRRCLGKPDGVPGGQLLPLHRP